MTAAERGPALPELVGVTDPDRKARLAMSFGAVAESYTEHRPDYAKAAVRWALSSALSSVGSPGRILDLGAGTGKLTEMLAETGGEVTAVEPDEAMLAELARRLPDVRALPGSAEHIPLADGSVDAVLCGQAMHWFDLDRALPEIARVLVPGGVLAGLWNSNDDRVPWVAGLQDVIGNSASRPLTYWRTGTDTRDDRMARFASPLYTPAERTEFPHAQPRTADSLVETIATHSRVLVLAEPDRARLLERLRDYLRTRPETATDQFMLPIITTVIRMVRK